MIENAITYEIISIAVSDTMPVISNIGLEKCANAGSPTHPNPKEAKVIPS